MEGDVKSVNLICEVRLPENVVRDLGKTLMNNSSVKEARRFLLAYYQRKSEESS